MRQAIIRTNAGILLKIEILIFSLKKMHLKVSSVKRRPFCLGLNVLMICNTRLSIVSSNHNLRSTFVNDRMQNSIQLKKFCDVSPFTVTRWVHSHNRAVTETNWVHWLLFFKKLSTLLALYGGIYPLQIVLPHKGPDLWLYAFWDTMRFMQCHYNDHESNPKEYIYI